MGDDLKSKDLLCVWTKKLDEIVAESMFLTENVAEFDWIHAIRKHRREGKWYALSCGLVGCKWNQENEEAIDTSLVLDC